MKNFKQFKQEINEAKKYVDIKNYDVNKKLFKNLSYHDILKSAQDTSDKTDSGFIKSIVSMYGLSLSDAKKAWKAYSKEPEVYNPNPSFSQ